MYIFDAKVKVHNYNAELFQCLMEAVMKTMTPTELRSNIFRVLDEILATGIPVEVKRSRIVYVLRDLNSDGLPCDREYEMDEEYLMTLEEYKKTLIMKNAYIRLILYIFLVAFLIMAIQMR